MVFQFPAAPICAISHKIEERGIEDEKERNAAIDLLLIPVAGDLSQFKSRLMRESGVALSINKGAFIAALRDYTGFIICLSSTRCSFIISCLMLSNANSDRCY